MKHVWNSKWTFILAAVGSAAWLGNLWRFPFQVYDNGWAVFIVVYAILLFVIWLWLLFWEIAYWQRAQAPWPQAFAQKSKRLSWIWWAWALCCLAIVTYYSSVIGWSLDYLWYSLVGLFQWSLPRAGDATWFFYNSILQISESPSDSWGFSMPVLLAMIVAWVLIYLFTFKSATSVGKVVRVTATLPFVFLILLVVRAVTLPWASLWFDFLSQVDWSRIGDTTIWLAAAWQIFFSLSIWFGMMLTYGALKKDKSEVMWSAFIVLIWDTITSLLSSILVFGTLWFMATSKGVAVTEISTWGPWLAFITIPETIMQLPFAPGLFAVLFFATIFFLAIDSAMAMVETVVNPIKRMIKWLSIEYATLIVCVVLGLLSLFFARQNGLYLLDVVDHYINSVAVIVIAIFEILVFISAWKPLTQFMKNHSDKRATKLFPQRYFLVVWVLTVVFLTYTLIVSFKWWLLSYDTYDVQFLWNWLWVILVIFVLAITLNVILVQKTSETLD